MNPNKAKLLETLDESARVHSASLLRSLDIAAHPEQHGWQRSILTAVVLPLTGFSALLTQANRFLVAQSDDEAWDRSSPPTNDSPEPRTLPPTDSPG